MGQRTCSIDGCTRSVRYVKSGLCNMHYLRIRRTGAAGPAAATQRNQSRRGHEQFTPADILRDRGWTVAASGCWEYAGYISKSTGYGMIRTGRSNVLAHRMMYEMKHGPIPQGAVVRHACDNPPCINPAHLSLGTKRDNTYDMVDRQRSLAYSTGRYGDKCKNGIHDITLPGALVEVINKSGNIGHRCRECERKRGTRAASTT